MGRLTNGTATFALAALVGLCWPTSDAAARMVYGRGGEPLRRPGTSSLEFVCEGGLAEPQGTFSDTFGDGDGLGAGTGFEVGLRLRQHLGGGLAVSPVFHYVSFGSVHGVGDFAEGDNLAYEVATSVYRYGLDLQYELGQPRDRVRPYLTGGIALAHNRYRDSLAYYEDFVAGMDGPSWTAGCGLKLGTIELSANYVWNRFESADLTAGPEELSYDWDYAVVRLGFAFGAD